MHASISTVADYKIPNVDYRVSNASVNLFVGDRKILQLMMKKSVNRPLKLIDGT